MDSSNRNCYLKNSPKKLSFAEMVPVRGSFSYNIETEQMGKHYVQGKIVLAFLGVNELCYNTLKKSLAEKLSFIFKFSSIKGQVYIPFGSTWA